MRLPSYHAHEAVVMTLLQQSVDILYICSQSGWAKWQLLLYLNVAVDRTVFEDLDCVVHEPRLEVEEVEDPPESVAVDAEMCVLDTALPASGRLIHERVELFQRLLLLHCLVQVAQADRPFNLQLPYRPWQPAIITSRAIWRETTPVILGTGKRENNCSLEHPAGTGWVAPESTHMNSYSLPR